MNAIYGTINACAKSVRHVDEVLNNETCLEEVEKGRVHVAEHDFTIFRF